MEKIVSFCKRRGFIFQSSEIYGGFASCYDYGPLGVEFKNNVKREWWKTMVQQRPDIVGLDASIIMNPRVWEASGHIEGFTDPLVDCKSCKKRFRADHLLEAKGLEPGYLKEKPETFDEIKCPECGGDLTQPRSFNLLMKTHIGPVEDEASVTYLRGETCQGIYTNYENVRESMRLKLPFGIAQIGKAFRNEITPGNFIFRMREFEQMEMQYFIKPDEGKKWFDYWKPLRMKWYQDLGVKKEKLRLREHAKDELAHYAKEAWDIEYDYPFGGFNELAGIHNRGDWDLSRHSKFSGKDLSYFDEETKEKFIPYVIETSDGADRAALVFLLDAYEEIEGGRTTTTDSTKEMEVVLRLDKRLAPIKIAILPLSKKPDLEKVAKDIQAKLWTEFMTAYDVAGSIGRRYRRQDEIGTPYCLTVDFESLEDKKITVRDRDTMKQDRVNIEELRDYFLEKFKM
ncbi:MAG: glycine--tRNA ligase [Candidatus Buchananbacteria bacterium RBG_13_36_9]|uniref:Glycine--tRNA ligase n=1 Tax=Candidatus Buchananbacteria bacterium RBG_13_36_9 TaxID=1797530 RepID=A0A1G1XM56_9BACT|nr:MAG: glycine--tRNA ligase [Candidatus Buchananbacteria bacterium RBG_13_36_9]